MLNTHDLGIKVFLVLFLFDTSPVICFGFYKTLIVLVSPKRYGEHTLSIQSTYQGKCRSFVFWLEKTQFHNHKKLSLLFLLMWSIILSITDLYLMLFPGFNSNFYHKNLEIVFKKITFSRCFVYFFEVRTQSASWVETKELQ